MVAALAGGVSANIPDAALSDVPPVLLVPNNPNTLAAPFGPNNLGYSVDVVGNLGPVGDAVVELIFSSAAWTRIAKCNGSDGNPAFCDVLGPTYVCTATTVGPSGLNGNPPGTPVGRATFFISGGGCILAAAVNPFTVEVRANGVVLANDIKIFSPDVVNAAGQTTAVSNTSNCDVNLTQVGLSDATFHTGDFAGITYNACSDFNDSNTADLPDAVIGGQYIVNSNNCSCTP
jgi:hypothetical protein